MVNAGGYYPESDIAWVSKQGWECFNPLSIYPFLLVRVERTGDSIKANRTIPKIYLERTIAPFRRWQKGKMIFLASLSCWIIFTLPLAFMQPPATSCLVIRNGTAYLEAPNPKTRIVKRSATLDDFYHQNDEECLEIADNVVFERLRKDSKLDPLAALSLQNNRGRLNNYDSNRLRRETQVETTTTEDSPVEDLKYKQLVFDENDPEAKTIDFETLQRKNRPADVLEYKRFLNVSFVKLKGKISHLFLYVVRSFFNCKFPNYRVIQFSRGDSSRVSIDSRINHWTMEDHRRRRTRTPKPG